MPIFKAEREFYERNFPDSDKTKELRKLAGLQFESPNSKYMSVIVGKRKKKVV